MSARERGLILLLLLVVVPLGLWFLVAAPAMEARDAAINRLTEARSLDAWVRARDAEWQAGSSASDASVASIPVGLSGLDRALTSAGLRSVTTRLENAPNGGIALRLEGAEFVAVGAFLEQVERELGYDIASLRVLRGDEAGRVSADLELLPEG